MTQDKLDTSPEKQVDEVTARDIAERAVSVSLSGADGPKPPTPSPAMFAGRKPAEVVPVVSEDKDYPYLELPISAEPIIVAFLQEKGTATTSFDEIAKRVFRTTELHPHSVDELQEFQILVCINYLNSRKNTKNTSPQTKSLKKQYSTSGKLSKKDELGLQRSAEYEERWIKQVSS